MKEIWGYLLQGRENEIRGNEPFTDICYFSASINSMGRLKGPDKIPVQIYKLPGKIRTHLVVSELNSGAVSHFILSPELPVRKQYIADICKCATAYNGVQIDFEMVDPIDGPNFESFLIELKKALGGEKLLSVALPARKKFVSDAYSYQRISAIADRIMIMAYDEHWSTGSPGPVASLNWCRDVMQYALSTIDNNKLIFGVPLYARAWQDRMHHRAVTFREVTGIFPEDDFTAKDYNETGPNKEYSENVKVKLYYDNYNSIWEKMNLYSSNGVTLLAFWRIGQEPLDFWEKMQIIAISR